MAAPERKVVVVGAGLAGLAAATRLAGDGLSVTVLEQAARAGGRAACTREQGFALEALPPLVSGADRALLGWVAGVGAADDALPLRPVVTAQFARGRVSPVEPRGILDVARIPGVRPLEALRLLRLPRLLRRYGARLDPDRPENAAALDDRSLADFARLYFGASVLDWWMEPELAADTLSVSSDVSRALYLRRLRARTRARPGLLRCPLGDVAEAATRRVRVFHASRARVVEEAACGLRVRATVGARERIFEAHAVVLATPAPEAVDLAPAILVRAEQEALAGVEYAPAVAVAVALRRPLGPHPELLRFPHAEGSPLGTALLEPGAGGSRAPDGRGLATLRATARWSATAAGLPDETIEKELVGAFEAIRPELRQAILFARVLRTQRALPRFGVGHYRKLARLEALGAELRASGRRLYLAGDYLADPSWAGALASAERVADAVRADIA